MTDLELLEKYISRCRSFGRSMQRGGLKWMMDEGTKALEALARVKQPRFEWEARKPDKENADV